MLNVGYAGCRNKVHYGDYHYTEYNYAECNYAECRKAIFDTVLVCVSIKE
jgi:hypothetical protein